MLSILYWIECEEFDQDMCQLLERIEGIVGAEEWVKGYEQFFKSVMTYLHQRLHRPNATFGLYLQEKYYNVHCGGTAIKNILAAPYCNLDHSMNNFV